MTCLFFYICANTTKIFTRFGSDALPIVLRSVLFFFLFNKATFRSSTRFALSVPRAQARLPNFTMPDRALAYHDT